MEDKKTLITIIVLLVVFLPLSILGTRKHFFGPIGPIDDNSNKDFIYNNKVYFYNNDKLLRVYECGGTCSKAESVLDDINFHTNSYRNGNVEVKNNINNILGLFKEGENIILYNIGSGSIVDTYQKIKNYNVALNQEMVIAQKNNLWGVTFLDFSNPGLKYDYDYIGIPSHFKNGLLDVNKFITQKDSMWNIFNADGKTNYSISNIEIVDFSDNYYITYDGNNYHIMDLNNNEVLTNIIKDNVYGIGKYVGVLVNNNLIIYEDCVNEIVKENIVLPEYQELYFDEVSNGINIMIDGKIYQTIALS